MRIEFAIAIAAVAAFAQNGGMAPRPDASDYPAHAAAKGSVLAAVRVPPDQLKKIFNADLAHAGYVVFEIAVYPDAAREPEISPGDFMLRALPDTSTMRPAEANVVAAAVIPYDKPRTAPTAMPGNVHVYTEATIGYESGGPYRRGGVYTGGGVAVTNAPPGPPPPPVSAKDQARDDLQISLADKGLKAGRVQRPLAGYLYFPKPAAKGKVQAYEITYFGPDAPTRLVVKAGGK